MQGGVFSVGALLGISFLRGDFVEYYGGGYLLSTTKRRIYIYEGDERGLPIYLENPTPTNVARS